MEKKTKNIFIAVVSVLVLVLAAIVVFILISPGKTDKELISEHFEKSLAGIKNISIKEDNFVSKVLSDDNTVVRLYSDTSVKVVEDGEEMSYNFEGEGFSKGIEEVYGKLLLLENSEKVLDLEAVVKDSKIYHKINDVYSKFYYDELDFTEIENVLENEQLELETKVDETVFVDYLVEVFEDKLKNTEVEREEKEIKLGKEKRSVDKITASFTEKDLLEMLKNYVKKVDSNKDIKKLLNELVEKEMLDEEFLDEYNVEDLIEEIDSMIEDADNKRDLFRYVIYLDGKDVVSNEFVISVESDEQDVNVKLVFNSYKNKEKNKVEEVYLSLMGIKMVTFEVEYDNENEYDLALSVYSMFDIDGKVKETDSGFDAKFTGKMSMMNDDGNTVDEEFFNLVIKSKKLDKGNKISLDVKLDVEYEDVEFNIDSKNEFEINAEMPNVDLSGAKASSEMSDKEKEAYDDIFGYSYVDDDYDYDYSYDEDLDYNFEYSVDEDFELAY